MAVIETKATAEVPGLVSEETTESESTSMFSLFQNRDFRLLWIGEAVSLIGDQFHLIALPWLVLQLTGDAFAMGTVLALQGIPRAIFYAGRRRTDRSLLVAAGDDFVKSGADDTGRRDERPHFYKHAQPVGDLRVCAGVWIGRCIFLPGTGIHRAGSSQQ